MASKEIAVQGLTLTVSGGGPGTASVTSSPSTKLKAGGNGVYKDPLNISINGCVSGGCTQNAPVSDSISATAQKVKSENSFVMRKNDKKTGIVINGLNGVGAPCSFTVDVEITDAGQTKAKAS